MATTPTFDDEETRLLLIGTEEDIARGFTQIDTHLRAGISGMVRREFPGIPAQDLADLWGCVLLNLLEIIRDERFDADKPLLPLLCRLARARATDHRRRQERRDRVVTAVGEALRGTAAGLRWGGLSTAERGEALSVIQQAVVTLPARQRLVMQVFVDNYPDTADMQELRRLVSEESRQPETLAAVKRALQEARAKVREHLRSRGYDFAEVDES